MKDSLPRPGRRRHLLARGVIVFLTFLILADVLAMLSRYQVPKSQRSSHDTFIMAVEALIAAGLLLTLLLLAYCHYLDLADGPTEADARKSCPCSTPERTPTWEAGTSSSR